MIILGTGMGMSFVPVTIAGTSGVAPGGLRAGLGPAEHDPAGRRLARPGDPLLGRDEPHHQRAAHRLGAAGRADARIQGRLHRRCGSVRDGRGLHDRAAARSAPRTRRRGGRDDRAVVRALPRRAVLRPPRARGRLRPPCAHPRRTLVEAGANQHPSAEDPVIPAARLECLLACCRGLSVGRRCDLGHAGRAVIELLVSDGCAVTGVARSRRTLDAVSATGALARITVIR